MQELRSKEVVFDSPREHAAPAGVPRGQTGSLAAPGSRGVRQSGMSAWWAGCLAAWFGGAATAQGAGFEVALRDGSTVVVQQIRGDAQRGFELQGATGKRQVAAGELLAIHGVAASVPELLTTFASGGEVLRGPIVGGDSAGGRVELLSPTLGRVSIAVDRLVAVLTDRTLGPTALRLPNGVEEALFVRAGGGYDILAGTLHQFGELGVRFQPDGNAAPKWFGSGDFLGLVFSAVPPPPPSPVWMLTRTAERFALQAPAATEAGFRGKLLGDAEVLVSPADVACLSFGEGVVFASDLEPKAVDESGCEGEVVLPWQRDRSVVGGPLVAFGRAHGKGLGVHSRSRLVFTVPAGCERFWTRVGLDDCVLQLPMQPAAVARVVHNGKVVFRADDLRAGQAPRDCGMLAVAPGDEIALEVDFGKGRDLGDRVDWLSPVFLPAGPRRP